MQNHFPFFLLSSIAFDPLFQRIRIWKHFRQHHNSLNALPCFSDSILWINFLMITCICFFFVGSHHLTSSGDFANDHVAACLFNVSSNKMNLTFNKLILFVLSHICMYFYWIWSSIQMQSYSVLTHSNYRIHSVEQFLYLFSNHLFVRSFGFIIIFGYETILLVAGPSHHHHNSIQFAFAFQFYTFHILKFRAVSSIFNSNKSRKWCEKLSHH